MKTDAEQCNGIESDGVAAEELLLPPDQSLIQLCVALQELRSHASSLGLFTEMREFLTCPKCGLHEDVLIDGRLVTYQGMPDVPTDSGLRFTPTANEDFVCPVCGEIVAAPTDSNFPELLDGYP